MTFILWNQFEDKFVKAVISHANTLDTPSHTYITGPIHTKTMNMDKKLQYVFVS